MSSPAARATASTSTAPSGRITSLPLRTTRRPARPATYGQRAREVGPRGHAEEYGLSCTDCHHANADIEPEPARCTACHLDKPMGDIPDMKTAAHAKCADCHQEWFDAGMKGCTSCHPFTDNRKLSASGQPRGREPRRCRLHGLPRKRQGLGAHPRPHGGPPRQLHEMPRKARQGAVPQGPVQPVPHEIGGLS